MRWETYPKDEGKTATLTITCTDGQYPISQSFSLEIEKKNKTEEGAASDSNNQTSQFANNRPEEETVKLDATFAAKIKASVVVGGRNYTLKRPTVYMKSIDN